MKPHLQQLAELVGATTMGDPPHFLFSVDQIERFAELIPRDIVEFAALADRLERVGKKVDLIV